VGEVDTFKTEKPSAMSAVGRLCWKSPFSRWQKILRTAGASRSPLCVGPYQIQQTDCRGSYRFYRPCGGWNRKHASFARFSKPGDFRVFQHNRSKPVLTAPNRHFRSTPNNGRHLTGPVGPFGAITGLLHCRR